MPSPLATPTRWPRPPLPRAGTAIGILGLALALTLLLVIAQPAGAVNPLVPHLADFWAEWAVEIAPLWTANEEELFDDLESDVDRERFLTAFWAGRGDAALDRWRQNRLDAEQLRARAAAAHQVLLQFGKPAEVDSYPGCGGLRALEVWRWEPWQIDRQGGNSDDDALLVLVQVKRFDPRSLAPWDPADLAGLGHSTDFGTTLDAYVDGAIDSECDSQRERGLLRRAVSVDDLQRLMPWPAADPAWLSEFEQLLASEPQPTFPAALELTYPGSDIRRTVLHGQVRIDRDQLRELIPGQIFDTVTLAGDLYQGPRLVNSFEAIHHIAGAAHGSSLYLDFYRRLRPGRYVFHFRAADHRGLALLREELELVVPQLDYPAPPPPGRTVGLDRLTRSEVVMLDTFPSVEVLPVATKGASRVPVLAITTGGPIAAVEFHLDGRLVATDDEPPYLVEVDIAEERQRMAAVALDPSGQPLARHESWIEGRERPFAVRLETPEPGAREVVVAVSLPAGEALQKIDCYRGSRQIATLTSPPFSCPLSTAAVVGLDYLRVAATLDSGDSTEDVLFLGNRTPEEVDVRLVELYVSVYNGNGRPVVGLGLPDFRVLENGEERPVAKVASLADLPLSVAVLLDVSSSMGRRVHLVGESAQRFFRHILTADDEASLLAFNHDLHQLVPFTSEVGRLEHGATGLRAWGSTRLHDGIVWALSQFAGQENRRALVVLSDGADVVSDFPFPQVLFAARQAGVAVYTISLAADGNDRRGGKDGSDEATSRNLRELADRTGGSFFAVDSLSQLDTVYRRIEEELRSQYLLTYSTETGTTELMPGTLDVQMTAAGLTARAVHGYYQ